MNDPNEAKEGVDALGEFFQQFGPLDVYSRVLWEVVLEELYGINSDEMVEEEEKDYGDDD